MYLLFLFNGHFTGWLCQLVSGFSFGLFPLLFRKRTSGISGIRFLWVRCFFCYPSIGWLGRWVVSVLNSGALGPGFKSQSRCLSGNSLRKTVHTHHACVHQAAKLVAALLRVARVTAGLVESNGSLPPGLWLTSPAGSAPEPYAR